MPVHFQQLQIEDILLLGHLVLTGRWLPLPHKLTDDLLELTVLERDEGLDVGSAVVTLIDGDDGFLQLLEDVEQLLLQGVSCLQLGQLLLATHEKLLVYEDQVLV